MEAKARLKNCPMSARKMRLVVDQVRGKKVDEALNIAKFSKKEAGVWIEKLLLSAIANWENKANSSESAADYDLVVKTAFVDQGTMLKRFRPAPQGRAHRIRKHTNHVTLVVENSLQIDNEPSLGSSEEE
jgi:large subunit ribosomal protein L22